MGLEERQNEQKPLETPGNRPKKFNFVVRIREVGGSNFFGSAKSGTTAGKTAVVFHFGAEIL